MKLTLSFLFFLLAITTFAQLKPVDEKSEVKFIIKNFGLNTSGSFTGLKGTIQFDSTKLPASFFNVTINAATVNTGIDARDNHLRKEEYFDVEKYPVISFKSTEIKKTGDGFLVLGNLTIKSTTKNIAFSFTVTAQSGGLILKGSFSINRKDYSVGGTSAVLGNNVDIDMKVFAQ